MARRDPAAGAAGEDSWSRGEMWGVLGRGWKRARIDGQPRNLVELYSEITKGRGLAKESGKIRLILFPAIRYFTYFITKCVLARRNASKLSVYDLAFISAALRSDRTFNLGALIAHRLSINHEKGGV